jgi:hypothetical protein
MIADTNGTVLEQANKSFARIDPKRGFHFSLTRPFGSVR